jgi:hypothetical protein
MYGQNRRRIVRRPAPNSSIEEGRNLAGLGELPEDLYKERELRPPILTPRGNPSDNPFNQMPPPAQQPTPSRTFNPQSISTYRVNVPANTPTPIFAATRERSYALVVNGGANPAVIAYSRAPADANDGIPLAALGVGFHELVFGCTSTMTAFSTAGTFLIVTEGRYDPAMEL